MKNVRKLDRKRLHAPIDILAADTRQNIGIGTVSDLHEDGLCLLTADKLETGREILLDFRLPNGWKLDFFGKVMYSKKAVDTMSYGIKFSPGQATFILKLV